jgi:PAS domain S-box-containing protein
MALVSLDGRFLKVNDSLLDIIGYSEEELLATRFQAITHPEDLEADLAHLDHVIAGEIRSYQMEKRYIHKLGHEVWILLNGSLVHDAQGDPIYAIAQIQDITERKRTRDQIEQSLKEKEVLLKEIHHRVKNNLQIIHSLFNLQSHHTEDRRAIDILRESQNRVISMALVHEHLYQSKDLASIDFAKYVKTLSQDLLHSYESDNGRLSLEVSTEGNLLFNIDTAIPCGLIIGELVSNAIKHGFPNGREGHINVLLSMDTDDEAIIIVKDDGVGFPRGLNFRNTTSLGLQLVNILVSQLGGSIEKSDEGGATFRLTFPTAQ